MNFLEYEVINEDEWLREWSILNSKEDNRFCFVVKHIEMDRYVVGDEMELLLKDLFVRLASVSGVIVLIFSIQFKIMGAYVMSLV